MPIPIVIMLFVAVLLVIPLALISCEKIKLAIISGILIVISFGTWIIVAGVNQKEKNLLEVPVQFVLDGENKIPVVVYRGIVYSLQDIFYQPITKDSVIVMKKMDKYSYGIDFQNEKIYPDLLESRK